LPARTVAFACRPSPPRYGRSINSFRCKHESAPGLKWRNRSTFSRRRCGAGIRIDLAKPIRQ
jgi:hypothetical protein